MDRLASFSGIVPMFVFRSSQYGRRVPMISFDHDYGHENFISFFDVLNYREERLSPSSKRMV